VRVLVTGSSGFLGREVVHQLTTAGHDVVALTRRRIVERSQIQNVSADLTDARSILEAVAEAGTLDAVCHLAALTQARESKQDPLTYWDVNTAGTLRLIQAIARQTTPARVVLASTGAVYGAGRTSPIPEDTPLAPTSPYGRSKAAAEAVVGDAAAAGIVSGVVIRTFNLAGSSLGLPDTDTTRVIPAALAVATGDRDSFRVNGTGATVREYTHVSDVARAYLMAVEHPQQDGFAVYNVGSGHGSSVLDVLQAVRAVTGHEIPVDHRPAHDEPTSLVADITRATHDLDWQPERSDLTDLVADAWQAIRTSRAASEPANPMW